MHRFSRIDVSLTCWRSGSLGQAKGYSSEEDCTWRGAALPTEHLQWYQNRIDQSFRTNMFVASSFLRSIAEDFCERAHTPCDPGKALWKFRFEKLKCRSDRLDDCELAVRWRTLRMHAWAMWCDA